MSAHELPDDLALVSRSMRGIARRSRESLAIILCLALALVFSATDRGVAVSSDGSAACAQYAQRCDPARDADPSGNDPSGKLPFTGAASLLVLGIGGVLLLAGTALRSRAQHESDDDQ